jgi:hypothetical protein
MYGTCTTKPEGGTAAAFRACVVLGAAALAQHVA